MARSKPDLRGCWGWRLSNRVFLARQVATAGEALQTLAAEPAGGVRAEGVMIGRAAWKKPWDTLGDADRAVFGAATNPAASRRQVGAPLPPDPRWSCTSERGCWRSGRITRPGLLPLPVYRDESSAHFSLPAATR